MGGKTPLKPPLNPSPPPPRSGSSVELLRRAQQGDRSALDAVFGRHLPTLNRWARGRLPAWARSVADTADLVQDVMLNVFRRLDGFEIRRKGALQAYLRQAIQNRVRYEFRTFHRRPPSDPLDSAVPDEKASPLDLAVDAETRRRYDDALARLRASDQELIVGVVELGYSYQQLAVATGRSTPDAARVAARRALQRLAQEMGRV